jgi:uncharacterized protein (TIGR03437 family)
MRTACFRGAAAAALSIYGFAVPVRAAGTGITVSPTAITFSYQVNSATLPAAAKLTANLPSGTSSSTTMSAQVTSTPPGWLSVTPDNGHSPLAVTVMANPTGLAPASYSGVITIQNDATPTMTATVNVTLSITNPPSILLLSPPFSANYAAGSGASSPTLSFSYTTGDPAPTPASSTLNVASSGDIIPFNVTAALAAKTTGGVWINVNQANQLPSASTSGVALSGALVPITVSLDLPAVATLDPGSYGGSVTIAANNKINGSIPANVNLVVSAGAPTIASIYPNSIVAGPVVNPVITIYGQNFFNTSVVTLQQGTGTPITLPSTLLGRKVLQATVNAALLTAPGNWTLAVTNPAPPNNPSQPPSTILFTVADQTTPVISGVVSAASYLPLAAQASTNTQTPLTGRTTVAPREIVSIFGQNLALPANLNAATVINAAPSGAPSAYQPGPLAGVTVTLTGSTTNNSYQVPILMVSSNQVNAIIPSAVAAEASVIIQLCNGTHCTALPPIGFPAMTVVPESPGIFTFGGLGQGQAAILNYNTTTQGYSINSSSAGASRGSTVLIYATGLGDFQKQASGAAMTDGQVAPPVALGVTDQTVRVDIGGQPAVVSYAGTCPGAVAGLVQINAVVPPTVTPGTAVTVVVSIGSPTVAVSSQAGVTLTVTK